MNPKNPAGILLVPFAPKCNICKACGKPSPVAKSKVLSTAKTCPHCKTIGALYLYPPDLIGMGEIC